ncbi:MAG: hypothetical protein HGA67_01235 [Candidatus Yonathbacteria bacterium]|nr:hypothetical protein [Candidatus Yonathbacteria bacterium]
MEKIFSRTAAKKVFAASFLALFLLLPLGNISIVHAQDAAAQTQASVDSKIDSLYNCELLKGMGGFFGCFVGAMYYAVYKPILFIFGWAGNFFDIVLAFSLSRDVIDQAFVRTVWLAVRDLSNMVFIFGIIWIAIATILQINGHQAKDGLVKLIIAALLINFSLFFTRAIIDVGNLSALFFYDAFVVEEPGNTAGGAQQTSGQNIAQNSYLGTQLHIIEVKGISQGFARFIDINQLVSGQLQNSFVTSHHGFGVGIFRIGGNANDRNMLDSESRLLILILATSLLLVIISWIFFTVSYLFITRIAMLWLLMALSPLAFAAMIIPAGRSKAKQLFWNELISKAFCITVFMFLLWIALIFIATSGETWNIPADGNFNFVTFLVLVSLKYIVIIAILTYAKKTTKKMCDTIGGVSLDIGKKLAGVITPLVGLGLGAATGGLLSGTGAIMRRTVGAGAAQTLETRGQDGLTTRQRLASGGMIDRLKLGVLENRASSTFDPRNSKIAGSLTNATVGKALGAAGVKVNTNALAVGQKFGTGGFVGQTERKTQEYTALRKKLGDVTDKDPEKAAAAQSATRRFQEQLDKESSSWIAKNIQYGSPYYNFLKAIREKRAVAPGTHTPVNEMTGNKEIRPSTPEEAAKLMQEYEKQNATKARNVAAESFANTTGFTPTAAMVGKAKAAKEAGEVLAKGQKTNEQRANLKRERDAQTAEYESLKNANERINPRDPATGTWADSSPTKWKTAADTEITKLNTSIDELTSVIKEKEKLETDLRNRYSNLTVQRSVQTDPEKRNNMLKDLQETDSQRNAVSAERKVHEANLKKTREETEVLKRLSKAAENMNRYDQRDINEYNSSIKK